MSSPPEPDSSDAALDSNAAAEPPPLSTSTALTVEVPPPLLVEAAGPPSSTSTFSPPPSLELGTESPSRRRRKPTASNTTPQTGASSKSSLRSFSSSSSSSGNSSGAGSFPTPFKCCGDFCGFEIQDPALDSETSTGGGRNGGHAPTNSVGGAMSIASSVRSYAAALTASRMEASTAMQLLFSRDERQLLGDDALQSLLASVHVTRSSSVSTSSSNSSSNPIEPPSAVPTSLACASASPEPLRLITYKSIALAKPNKQHLLDALQRQQTPTDSLSKPRQPPPHAARKQSRWLAPTMAHELREASRSRVFGGHDGGSNAHYYRQVRVCSHCYAVYALLDRARELAREAQDIRHGQGRQHPPPRRSALQASWAAMVNDEVTHKEKLYLRHGAAGAGAGLGTAASVPTLPVSVSQLAVEPTSEATDRDRGVLPPLASSIGAAFASPRAAAAASASASALATVEPSPTVVLPLVAPACRAVAFRDDVIPPSQALRSQESVVGMDKYLRGQSRQVENHTLHEGQLFRESEQRHSSMAVAKSKAKANPRTHSRSGGRPSSSSFPTARILLIDADATVLQWLHDTLTEAAATADLPFALQLRSLTDGHEALHAARLDGYDLLLMDCSLTTDEAGSGREEPLPGLELARQLRQYEAQRSVAASSSSSSSPSSSTASWQRTPLLALATQTNASDLQRYREAGLDGCIGKPLQRESLVRTVQAALSTRFAQLATAADGGDAVSAATDALARARQAQQERRQHRRRHEAARSLAMPRLLATDARDYAQGMFQMDAETAFPFCVLGERTSASGPARATPSNTFFNLVVVHDLFETWERLQILLNPLVTRYAGAVQVVVWNYPGQAYTTWRAGTVLNNTFHCQCLRALLAELGPQGRGTLRDAPFYLLGLGNGGNIATAFASLSPPPDRNARALVLVNAFTHVDAALAQFLHDCLKVFAVTPESRPDLPVYFHARFLFSPAYLARVTTPMALNLYTAVMNPITLVGRRALCQGALQHRDLRTSGPAGGLGPGQGKGSGHGKGKSPDPELSLSIPFISVCGTQDALVDAGQHARALASWARADLVDSIGKVLQQSVSRAWTRRQSSILWLASGHEVFQECKSEMLTLLEQLVTGFHELHDEPHESEAAVTALAMQPPSLSPVKTEDDGKSDAAARKGTKLKGKKQRTTKQPPTSSTSYEDTFIDRVLSTVNQVVPGPQRPHSRGEPASVPGVANELGQNTTHTDSSSNSNNNNNNNQATSAQPLVSSPSKTKNKSKWLAFQASNTPSGATTATLGPSSPSKLHDRSKPKPAPSAAMGAASWDPTSPAFERLSSNIIYKVGQGSKIYPDPKPHLTNKSKTTPSTSTFTTNNTNRAALVPEVKEYMAWRVQRNHKRLQRLHAQVRVIQRAFRAFLVRTMAQRRLRTTSALRVQRAWRVYLARAVYRSVKREDAAVRLLQRHWRGKQGRNSFRDRMRQYLAACELQRLMRGHLARSRVHRRRQRLHEAARVVQRVVRRVAAGQRVHRLRAARQAATTVQRLFRGHLGRRRAAGEASKLLLVRSQSQGISLGKQMLLEYKLLGRKLQSEVALLTSSKREVEAQAEALVGELAALEEGIRVLETEMHALAQLESESYRSGGQGLGLSQGQGQEERSKWQLREQKMRLDREFTTLLAQIATRHEALSAMERKLQTLERGRLGKEEELKALERKLVVLLDEQQRELQQIAGKQRASQLLLLEGVASGGNGSRTGGSSGGAASPGLLSGAKGAAATAKDNAASAFTTQQREEAQALMESTETMMKFGFMSMSMTYFSSMNMVRAMRKIGAHHLTLDSAAAVSNHQWPEYAPCPNSNNSNSSSSSHPGSFQPAVPPGGFPGQQPLLVTGWSVADVGRWLDTLSLAAYKRAFQDAAVDGALLLHLTDDDLRHTLGMEHRLHRKKVLTAVQELREHETRHASRLQPTHHQQQQFPRREVAFVADQPASPDRLPVAPAVSASPVTGSSSVEKEGTGGGGGGGATQLLVSFSELCSLVRHGKTKQVKEALAGLPSRRFDAATVAEAFAPGVGTRYAGLVDKAAFHINKGDENGNSALLLAAQNNHIKLAQLLLTKGANPDHQNKHGHTAGHYAMAYSFFDLGAWLLDPDKGGGRDDIVNENGLTAYDGLA